MEQLKRRRNSMAEASLPEGEEPTLSLLPTLHSDKSEICFLAITTLFCHWKAGIRGLRAWHKASTNSTEIKHQSTRERALHQDLQEPVAGAPLEGTHCTHTTAFPHFPTLCHTPPPTTTRRERAGALHQAPPGGEGRRREEDSAAACSTEEMGGHSGRRR